MSLITPGQDNFSPEQIRVIFEHVSKYLFQPAGQIESAIIQEIMDGNNTEGFEIAERLDSIAEDLAALSGALRMLQMNGSYDAPSINELEGAVNHKLSQSSASLEGMELASSNQAQSPDTLANLVNLINHVLRPEIDE